MATDGPQTWGDARLDDLCRRVFAKAVAAMEPILDGKDADGTNRVFSPERLSALASCADAAYCGVASEDGDAEESTY